MFVISCDYRGEKELPHHGDTPNPLLHLKLHELSYSNPVVHSYHLYRNERKLFSTVEIMSLWHINHTIIFSLQICEVICQSEYWHLMMNPIIRLIDSDKKDSFWSITDTVGFTDQEGIVILLYKWEARLPLLM